MPARRLIPSDDYGDYFGSEQMKIVAGNVDSVTEANENLSNENFSGAARLLMSAEQSSS